MSMHEQQLLERWWVPGVVVALVIGVVVALVIGVVDFIFCRQGSKVDEIE
jgi:hypothetical protein